MTQRKSAIDVSAFSDKARLVPFPWLRRNIATAQQTKATAACIHVLRQHHIRPPRPIIHYALFAAVRSALVSLSKMLQAVVSWPAWSVVVVGGHGGQLRRACLNEICGRKSVEEEDERGAAVCSRPTIMFNNVRKFLVYIGPNIL